MAPEKKIPDYIVERAHTVLEGCIDPGDTHYEELVRRISAAIYAMYAAYQPASAENEDPLHGFG